jgi:hypothetical protein
MKKTREYVLKLLRHLTNTSLRTCARLNEEELPVGEGTGAGGISLILTHQEKKSSSLSFNPFIIMNRFSMIAAAAAVVPGLFAGNDQPSWKDAPGQRARSFVVQHAPIHNHLSDVMLRGHLLELRSQEHLPSRRVSFASWELVLQALVEEKRRIDTQRKALSKLSRGVLQPSSLLNNTALVKFIHQQQTVRLLESRDGANLPYDLADLVFEFLP